MIDQPASESPMNEPVAPNRPGPPTGARANRGSLIPISLASVLVGIAFFGSLAYLAWVVLAVDEEQIPLLAAGFAVLGASFVAIAIGTLVGMWRAASRAEGGRALLLAIVGGIAGLAAIGCFTVTALSALVWNS